MAAKVGLVSDSPPLLTVRIAVNTRLLVDQPLEGMARYTLEVLRQLLVLRPEDDFLLICDRAGALPELPRTVERVTVYPSARHPLLFYAWFEWAVPRVLRRWRADVFVSLDNFCSLRSTVPTVLAVHDLAYLHEPAGVGRLQLAYYRHFMPRFVRRAERVVAVSQFTRQDIASAFGLSPKPIALAYNGVQTRFQLATTAQVAKTRLRYTDGAPYFLYTGAVHPRKNVDGLVRAFSRFCESEPKATHHLVLAGRFAWQSGPVGEALAASPVRDRIHALGYVPDDDLGALVAAADALCLVSRFEGFGVPILEAFACCVPVIVSNRSSLPEVAGPGGLLVDPEDDASIAAALARLAGDETLRQVLAKAGQAHTQHFTWQACTQVLSHEIDAAVATKT